MENCLDEKFTAGRLEGRVAIVTGGASGIGFATAKRLLNDGAKVGILDQNEAVGEEAAKNLDLIGYSGNDVIFVPCDVTSDDSIHAAVSVVAKAFKGEIHILVNCAAFFSLTHPKPTNSVTELTSSEFMKSMDVNVAGYFRMFKACYPYMQEANKTRQGACCIVNISSGAGYHHDGGSTWSYCTSKAAILNLTRCMAHDLGPMGIRVNTVSPAYTKTPALMSSLPNGQITEETKAKWSKRHCLSRHIGLPEEQAAAIAFLCSKDASFITGADLPVDGGYLCLGPEPIN